uniref:Uncharacterized protein n=1 Tax=Leersia perrieri TaxID=77586 RepID=A0A0D9XBM0_9ORYZ
PKSPVRELDPFDCRRRRLRPRAAPPPGPLAAPSPAPPRHRCSAAGPRRRHRRPQLHHRHGRPSSSSRHLADQISSTPHAVLGNKQAICPSLESRVVSV